MIRPERTFERFSRGSELVRAIRALQSSTLSKDERAAKISALLIEFDLTTAEWCHWRRLASTI
jgi:hypothetical protein